MDKNKKTSKKQVIRNEKGQVIAGTPNPNGRPKGRKNFKTVWKEALTKIAEMNGIEPDEAEQKLLLRGYKEALQGNYNFYRDIFDRLYGKPLQSIDHTTDGQPLYNLSQDARQNAEEFEEDK